MEAIVTRAKDIRTRAKALLLHQDRASGDDRPNEWTMLQRIKDMMASADDVLNLLTSSQLPSKEQCAVMVTEGSAAIIAVAEHSICLSQDLARTRQDLARVRDELKELRGSYERLVLRQMATQMVNKLARLTIDELNSPYDARDITMEIVMAEGRPAALNELLGGRDVQRLQRAVGMLCQLAREDAHPVPNPMLTEQDLIGIMNRNLATYAKSQAQQVLECLVQLSAELKEDLFVSTTNPG